MQLHRGAAAVAAACVVLVLGGQALTDRSIATDAVSPAGETMGRAGFTYLTGLRTFAAAILYNRLDPQLHEYHENVPLDKQLLLVPNLRVIMLLDPRLVDAWYVMPWILAKNGKVAAAMELAKEGVDENPVSGKLLTAYADMLLTLRHDPKAAAVAAARALDRSAVWTNLDDEYTSMRMLSVIFTKTGDVGRSNEALARQAEVGRIMDSTGYKPSEDH